jgi:low temperature requirement protein LtrA
MGIRVEQPARTDGRAPWFQPPQLRTLTDEGERHASWLELFFDLVFVVAITELSRLLVGDHSAMGFVRFAALFVPVYVAWQGYMAYATRFDTDDLAFRVAYFAAMLAIAALAVLIDDVAHGKHSAEFALAYVALRSFMIGIYWRAWRAVPEARPLIRFYGGGYTIGIAIWLLSLAVDTPWRYAFWIGAQILALSLPPLSTNLHRRIPTSPRHLPERWALFTLIVLGESVVAVAISVSNTHWRAASVGAAVLGFTAVACVWWIYFDRQESVELRGSTMSVVVYSYAHIPLLLGLAMMSAGLRLVIERARASQLGWGASAALLGGVVLYLLSLLGTRSVTVHGAHRVGRLMKLVACTLLGSVLAAQTALPPVAVVATVAAILVAFVYAEHALIRE